MGRTHVRSQRIVVFVLIVLLVGCLGNGSVTTESPTRTPTPSGDGERTYVVFTEKLPDAPDSVTVVGFNNSSLRGDEMTKEYIVKTYEEGGLTERVDGRTWTQLEAELQDVPRTEGTNFGYYFEYRGESIHLYIGVEE
jgi:hypothetical protein